MGQWEGSQTAVATVSQVTFPQLGHPQHGAMLAHVLAEFLDARVPQLLVAHLQLYKILFWVNVMLTG